MEKKKLLFVIPSLAAGGGEKSLVNLLAQIDYTAYHVDLFLFNHEGIFNQYLPKQVRVLSLPETYKHFSLPIAVSMLKLLAKGKISVAYNRLLFSIQNRKIKDHSLKEQYTWKYIAKSISKIEKKYDAAIGFLEKTSTYFCVEKVDAVKKIGWVHIDYDKLGMDPFFDIDYFQQLDQIITVSEECANIFSKRFPTQKNKVEIIYNIVSPSMIRNMAEQRIDVYQRKKNETIILTIARLHSQKGLEMAIEACKRLKDKKHKIKWYVVGEGEERKKLTKLINENGLTGDFELLGVKSNPYPYLNQADLYVQPSKFEGKSIAIDEAKILHKPIVVTNFSTAKDQINNGIDGLIVDMDADALAGGIEKIILDQPLAEKFKRNLAQLQLGTEQEIEKLYKIL